MKASWLYYLMDGELLRFPLCGERVVIGRADGCDLVLDDRAVAAQHAVLMAQGHGWRVTPVSTRPLHVRGARCEATRTLRDGDSLTIGGTRLRYVQPRRVSGIPLQLGIEEPGAVPRFAVLDAPEVELAYEGGDIALRDPTCAGASLVIERPTPLALIVRPTGRPGAVELDGRPIGTRMRLVDGGVVTIGRTRIAVRLARGLRLPTIDTLLPFDLAGPRRVRRSRRQLDPEPEAAVHPVRPWYLPQHYEAVSQASVGRPRSGVTNELPVYGLGSTA